MSTGRLHGKVAFVTGGASGIGFGIVETFLKEGAKVFALDFSKQNISTSMTILAGRFAEDKVQFVEGDAANEDSVKGFVNECVAKFGGLDIAILNAGIAPKQKPLLDFSSAEYEHVMRVNAYGPFIGVSLCAKKMIELGTQGSIILTCSAAGLRSRPGLAPYTMSKYAVRGLTITAGQELAEYGIRVNAVCPGVIETPLVLQLKNSDAAAKACPMKRFGSPDEVAKMFLFLASDEASFVTASYHSVNGGLVDS